jgi:hypothetical protein
VATVEEHHLLGLPATVVQHPPAWQGQKLEVGVTGVLNTRLLTHLRLTWSHVIMVALLLHMARGPVSTPRVEVEAAPTPLLRLLGPKTNKAKKGSERTNL